MSNIKDMPGIRPPPGVVPNFDSPANMNASILLHFQSVSVSRDGRSHSSDIYKMVRDSQTICGGLCSNRVLRESICLRVLYRSFSDQKFTTIIRPVSQRRRVRYCISDDCDDGTVRPSVGCPSA